MNGRVLQQRPARIRGPSGRDPDTAPAVGAVTLPSRQPAVPASAGSTFTPRTVRTPRPAGWGTPLPDFTRRTLEEAFG
jgi:hypothetical protein